ncbi:hypothetical protein SAMN05880573_102217 [Chryseobacterium sp. RU33C]|nr:hypothetical protein SAMN05880573_102217 [Chryseobacterium sp. RU33C]
MKTRTLAMHPIMKIAFFIGFLFCYPCESKKSEPLEPSQTNSKAVSESTKKLEMFLTKHLINDITFKN